MSAPSPKRQKLIPVVQEKSAWRSELDEKGWTVLPNMLTPERCRYYEDEMFKMLESFEGSGFSRADPSTWRSCRPPNVHGLLQQYGVGQMRFVWEARVEKQVLNTFAELWGCKPSELLVSFDAVNFSPPVSEQERERQKRWKHIDQGRRHTGKLVCVQGCLQLTQCNGGTSFVTGSHAIHEELLNRPGLCNDTANWVKLRPEDYVWLAEEKKLVTERPQADAGSLILWDSRTVHDADLPSDGHRMAIYVCYRKRSCAAPIEVLRKQEVFRQRRMTTHWPFGDRMFPTQNRWTDAEKRRIFTDRPPILDSEMTDAAWCLAGFRRRWH